MRPMPRARAFDFFLEQDICLFTLLIKGLLPPCLPKP
jgi:hypothetical protein